MNDKFFLNWLEDQKTRLNRLIEEIDLGVIPSDSDLQYIYRGMLESINNMYDDIVIGMEN